MLPGRLSRLLASAKGPWDLIADDMIILPQEARLSFSLHRASDAGQMREIDLESFVVGNISRAGRPRGELGFLKPVVSRDFMRVHGLLYDETIRLGEDYAFYVSALLQGARFQLVSACGYVAVERQDSLSSRHSAEDLRRIVQFDDAVLPAIPSMAIRDRRALIRHRNATWRKFAYAAALEARKRDGFAAGLNWLARMPAAIPYVMSETLRAKTKMLRHRLDGGAAPETQGLRFLIGLPETRFADVRPLPSMDEEQQMSAMRR
jgi:succinoglycan biosynthesis protein ExoU